MPVVIGRSVESARVALESVPLAADVIYVPAKPRTRPGRGGEAAAARRVPLRERQRPALGLDGEGRPRAEPRRLEPARTRWSGARSSSSRSTSATADGPAGTVLEQSLEPGIALRPGLPITLLVGRGSTS